MFIGHCLLDIGNYIVGHELVVADACCKLHGIGRILLNVEQTATAIFCIICSVFMGGNCMIAAAKLVIYSVLPKKMRRKMRMRIKKKIEEDMPLISGGDRRRYICQLQKLMSSIFFYLPLSSSIFLYLPLSSSTTYWSGLTTTVAVPLMSYQTSPLLTTKAFTAEGISNKATRSTTCFLKRKEKLCVIILLFFCRS